MNANIACKLRDVITTAVNVGVTEHEIRATVDEALKAALVRKLQREIEDKQRLIDRIFEA